MKILDWLLGLVVTIIIALFIAYAFGMFTDRICDKPYSKEFKQTEQYKEMQCPENF